MKLRNNLAMVAFVFCLPAQAEDLNMEHGNWEMKVHGEFMNSVIVDEVSTMCTDSDDLNSSVDAVLSNILSGMKCSYDSINKMSNTYSGAITCDANSPFSKGEYILISSPRNISLYLKANAREPLQNEVAVMTTLMHRIGPCQTGQ